MAGVRRSQHLSDGTVEDAVAAFGEAVGEKLGRGGAPEDQLRGPLEVLLKRVGLSLGVDAIAYGEVRLQSVRARPDYAVDVGGSRVGYVEVKAPNRGVPGSAQWRPSMNERRQFDELSALPSVIYTDGTSWRWYTYGTPKTDIIHFEGDLTDPRTPITVSNNEFGELIRQFLTWQAEKISSIPEVIRRTAGLCRLLRDEVAAILAGSPDHRAFEGLSLLAQDWRALLFPGLDDRGFADAYAQTIVFAMLLARHDGIDFDNSLLDIARNLAKKHSLIGRAFEVLLDGAALDELRTIDTLHRVIGHIEFPPAARSSVYVDLYEKFLAAYDPKRRRESGSYYTPEPVARSIVGFVDQILQTRLSIRWGFADDDVVVVDPAMGTGTFLVEVVKTVADTLAIAQGEGSRKQRLRELLSQRLVGFEIQVAPYAISELRIHQALSQFETEIPSRETRFLTDALENPAAQQGRIGGAATWLLERSRKEANRFKREVPVMVVMGNPPHVQNSKGSAPWIEEPRRPGRGSVVSRPALEDFHVPGIGRYASDLHGMPWLYWRWAIWKVFEAHREHEQGVVAFITPASFILGKAFRGLRRYLRTVCDEGWIIELSPEGNRSRAATRVFGAGVSRQLAIAIFIRSSDPDPEVAAKVHHLVLAGTRSDKISRLETLGPDDDCWTVCHDGWEEPFLPRGSHDWENAPALAELMPWRTRGVTTGRSWIYATDPETLKARWRLLVTADHDRGRRLFHEGRDRKYSSVIAPLPGFPPTGRSLTAETGDCPEPVLVAYRPFDRQWIIPDNRLMEVPRPPLWAVRSSQQIYVSEQDSHVIESGPGLIFSALITDLDHFNGRGGGVRPFLRNRNGTSKNIAPRLISLLSRRIGVSLTEEDLLAYMAAVAAHPGYTERFRTDLRIPGVRIPLTSEPGLWNEAVEIGSRVLWLQTFGECFHDETAARPRGHLAIAEQLGIRNPIAIEELPSRTELTYDSSSQTLHVGTGTVYPVSVPVWEYDVGGMPVLRHWLRYRTREYRGTSSELEEIRQHYWSAAMNDELLAIVAILSGSVAIHAVQRELLDKICRSPRISGRELTEAGVLPAAQASHNPPQDSCGVLERL